MPIALRGVQAILKRKWNYLAIALILYLKLSAYDVQQYPGYAYTQAHTDSLYTSPFNRCSLIETTGGLNVTKRISNNPVCRLGRLIGWSGAKHIQRKLNLSLDYETYFKWLPGMPKHYCLAIRRWQTSTSPIKTCTSVVVKEAGERSLHWSAAMMSKHIRDLLLITQLLIAEHYCAVWTLRFRAVAKLLFLTSTEWWPNRACFLSVTPPRQPTKCSHKQDRTNNDDRASQRQSSIARYKGRPLWDCKIQNSYSKIYKSMYLSSVLLQRHVLCSKWYVV